MWQAQLISWAPLQDARYHVCMRTCVFVSAHECMFACLRACVSTDSQKYTVVLNTLSPESGERTRFEQEQCFFFEKRHDFVF